MVSHSGRWCVANQKTRASPSKSESQHISTMDFKHQQEFNHQTSSDVGKYLWVHPIDEMNPPSPF
jgi:hypothetical protein